MSELRSIPAVGQLMQTRQAAEMVAAHGRPLTLDAIREVLAEVRAAYKEERTVPLPAGILGLVQEKLEQWMQPTMIPVINASGVILHTNLGRAPLSKLALQMVQNLTSGYLTLEYDLEKGVRGSRSVHAEALLTRLTGAEAALVVNNNAAALLLTLSALARRQRVIISRSQLVEIGGGFRVPDVLKQSGAQLVEVGTTNRVYLADYEEALRDSAALILRAHHSNFRLVGFTNEPSLEELVGLGKKMGIPVVDDLGSGALLDTAKFGLGHEPMPQESLAAGVNVVCFSGDKLLGGPQAGIILGRKDLLDKIKKHPLARAVRADKLCLAALAATLLHYVKDEAEREIPVWQMLARTPRQLQARAKRWLEVVRQGKVIAGRSTVGGGSLPEETLPTYLLALDVAQPNRFLARLRKANPPIIARVEDDRVVLDPRTVLAEQEGALLVGLQNALGGKKGQPPPGKPGGL